MKARLFALSDSEAARISTVLVEMHAPFRYSPSERAAHFPGVHVYGLFVVDEEFLTALDVRLRQLNIAVYRDGRLPAGSIEA